MTTSAEFSYDRVGQGQPGASCLVWKQTSKFVLESPPYRIEKFAAGEDAIADFCGWRYRVFRRNDNWDFQLAGPQNDPESAKQICEQHARESLNGNIGVARESNNQS